MRSGLAAAVAAASFLLFPTALSAQEKKEGDKKGADTDPPAGWQGEEVDMEPEKEEDTPNPAPAPADGSGPAGSDENPANPHGADETRRPVAQDEQEDEEEEEEPLSEYPVEEVPRPITLLAFMAEVDLEYPVTVSPFEASGLLSAHFGLTDRAEIGLRYGFGSLVERNDDFDYESGKAFSIEAVYLLRNWIGAQLAVPVMVDPFALGLTFGVPIKLTFLGKLALVFGRDLLSVRVYRFVPDVRSAAASRALGEMEAVNAVVPDGELNFNGQLFWQHDHHWAFDVRLGLRAPDFSLDDPPVLFDVGAQFSGDAGYDIGLRAGFRALDDAPDSFTATFFAAVRI